MSRILVINPNISRSVTALIEREARRVARPGTEVVMHTAETGVAYIETRLEAMLAGAVMAEIIAAPPGDARRFDAILIAAFGDPGLPALKELADVPVVGIAEAALATASLLGRRFSIIAITRRLVGLYRDSVESAGLVGRLASIRHLTRPIPDIGAVQETFLTELVTLADQVVQADGADVVIMAGAPLAGLARQVSAAIPVPVIDGISSGVAQCEALIALGCGSPRAGSLAPPARKVNAGLSPALQAALRRRADDVDQSRCSISTPQSGGPAMDRIRMFVNGQAMSGGSLNDALTGAEFLGAARTAAKYRFYSVRDEFPGLSPVDDNGAAVPGELYAMPYAMLRERLLPREPAELELGVIELADGSGSLSMQMRAEALRGTDVVDITDRGGWLAHLRSLR